MSSADIFALWDGATPDEDQRSPRAAPRAYSGTDHPYAVGALKGICDEIAGMAAGAGRDNALNAGAYRMAGFVASGSIDAQRVFDALYDAGRASGQSDAELRRVLRQDGSGGLSSGQADPKAIPERDPFAPGSSSVPLGEPVALAPAPDELDAFWSARPLLSHVHDYARARRVSPWATLGVVLTRVVTATPYFVVLPAIVGGHASLNLFVGLVGKSGSGKGAAESVAAECLMLGAPVNVQTTGSGEGIAHGFRHRERSDVVWNDEDHAVLFSVPEIDTLSALGNRQGATLMPELRRGWSGERLGFAYADPTKRLPVPAHEYRMTLVAGIQPGRAQTLLDDSDGGTPQRFLWLPAVDTQAPDEPPACPDPIRWRRPDFRPHGPFGTPSGGKIIMTVCDDAVRTIDGARLARLRGTGEALDGHGLLARLKVAAAFALADSRVDVSDEDWHLSGIIHRKSDATRAGVQQELLDTSRQANEGKAIAEASRAVIVSEHVEDAAAKRVARVIVARLRKLGDWTTLAALRRAVSSPSRSYVEEAVRRLLDAGLIEQDDGHDGRVSLRLREKTL